MSKKNHRSISVKDELVNRLKRLIEKLGTYRSVAEFVSEAVASGSRPSKNKSKHTRMVRVKIDTNKDNDFLMMHLPLWRRDDLRIAFGRRRLRFLRRCSLGS